MKPHPRCGRLRSPSPPWPSSPLDRRDGVREDAGDDTSRSGDDERRGERDAQGTDREVRGRRTTQRQDRRHDVPFDQREKKFGAAAQAGTAPDIMRAEIADVANWAARGLPHRHHQPGHGGRQAGLPPGRVRLLQLRREGLGAAAGARRAGAPLQQADGQGRRPQPEPAAPRRWLRSSAGAARSARGRASSCGPTRTGRRPGSGRTAVGCSTRSRSRSSSPTSGRVAGMTAYKRQFSSNCAFPNKDFANDYGNAQTAFKNGQVAMIVNGPWSTADILQGKEFAKLVEPRRRTDPEGAGRAGLAGRRERVRDQPELGERRRGVQVHLLADASRRSRRSSPPRTTCCRPARRRTSRRR